LQQKQAGWQSRLAGAGHAYAMQTASRGMSRQAHLEYVRSGLPALNALTDFLAHAKEDSSQWDKLATSLMVLHERVMSLHKHALLICEADQTERLTKLIEQSWQLPESQAADSSAAHSDDSSLSNQSLNQPTESQVIESIPTDFSKLQLLAAKDYVNDTADIAWLVATNVYHNAAVYPATTADDPDTAALMILAPYLRNGYLHSAIREKGGAYGGGAGYDANSCAFKFFSYRDPHCSETFEHFAQSIEWLLNEPQTEAQLEEAILGIISAMDKPGSPAGEAVKSCFTDLHGRGEAWQQKMRANILAVTIEDLKRVAVDYLRDKPCVRSVLAPFDKEAVVTELGFVAKRVKS
ncbi:MAG: peptidase M16, partial [Psychrobacter sp.]|nr:peptidase M16 [Psychrobacter sp.]